MPGRPQSPGLGVEGAVELLGPTEPRLPGLQVGPGGAGQGGRLRGGREEGRGLHGGRPAVLL